MATAALCLPFSASFFFSFFRALGRPSGHPGLSLSSSLSLFLSFVRSGYGEEGKFPPGVNAQPLWGCEVQLHPSLSTWLGNLGSQNITTWKITSTQPLEDWAYVTKWLINSIEWLLLCIVGPSWLCGVDLEICKTADGMIAT